MKETRRQRKRRRALSARFYDLTDLIMRAEVRRLRRINENLRNWVRTFDVAPTTTLSTADVSSSTTIVVGSGSAKPGDSVLLVEKERVWLRS